MNSIEAVTTPNHVAIREQSQIRVEKNIVALEGQYQEKQELIDQVVVASYLAFDPTLEIELVDDGADLLLNEEEEEAHASISEKGLEASVGGNAQGAPEDKDSGTHDKSKRDLK
jgi:hypothetical protein